MVFKDVFIDWYPSVDWTDLHLDFASFISLLQLYIFGKVFLVVAMSGRSARMIYVGNLPGDVREWEVEDLFYKVWVGYCVMQLSEFLLHAIFIILEIHKRNWCIHSGVDWSVSSIWVLNVWLSLTPEWNVEDIFNCVDLLDCSYYMHGQLVPF